ncbi:MAG: RNA methyltransferase [Acidobacteriota bacterium]
MTGETNPRERIEIVLVAPRNPLNIGAAGRAMANFGFPHLAVVAPFEGHWREARSAVGAPHILGEARETRSLEEALAACTLVLGTGTVTRRQPEQPVVPLPELAPQVAGELARGGRVALIFGPEKHGLTRQDLARCHRLLVIPTEARQPSMNLGQAVAVCLYELAARLGEPMPRAAAAQAPATQAEIERLAKLVGEVMEAARYSPAAMHAANLHDVQLLLRRLTFRAQDARRVLGLLRRILHRLHS